MEEKSEEKGPNYFLYIIIILLIMGIALAIGLLYFYLKYVRINFNN